MAISNHKSSEVTKLIAKKAWPHEVTGNMIKHGALGTTKSAQRLLAL